MHEIRARNQLYENICEFKFGMNETPKHPATNRQLVDVKLLHGNLAPVHDQNKELLKIRSLYLQNLMFMIVR